MARLAARQHGVVTREQLLAAGLGRAAIGHRLTTGGLHALYRGVYAVGHPVPAPHAAELAAVLACGPGSMLSHHAAGCLWGIAPPLPGRIDVTVAGHNRRGRPGVRVHRVAAIDRRDLRRRHGIPVSAPARTLLDLAGDLTPMELERAVAEAYSMRLVSEHELLAQVARTPHRRGAGALRALLRHEHGPALTRSEAERRLLALVREARLPAPEANVCIAGHEVDCLWRAHRFVLEVDGYAFHSSRAAFERDRRRDADLNANGLRVTRVTWQQIDREPAALVARLAAALAASTPPTATADHPALNDSPP